MAAGPHAAGGNGEYGELPPLSAGDFVGVLDTVTDGILVLDRDWRILYVNAPASGMLRRTPESLIGHHTYSQLPEAVGHPFHLLGEEALRSGRLQRLVAHYAPLERLFETRMFPHEDRLVVLFRDVTDEQRAEDELREHVQRIAEAERIVRFGIWKWDVPSGRVHWSDELHRIYGLRPGTFAGTVDAFVAQLHPADRERVQDAIAHSLRTCEPFAFHERIVRGDGAIRVLLSQGRVVKGPDGDAQALVGVCHDITERTTAERALGTSERRMRAILDNTPSLITVKDLDGRYLMGNIESQRLTGIPPDELVGKSCAEVFSAEISMAQRANDRLAASDGEPVYDEAQVTRDGEQRTYVTVTFALPDDEGVPSETCTIATDVTERRERESVRRERAEWTERITQALDDGRMVVFAQPVIALRDGSAAANELLVRMRVAHDRATVLGPDAFLPAAERFGLVQLIDVWMVRQALALSGGEVPRVKVNISAITMCDPQARGAITELLAGARQAARSLVFEVTETASVVQLEAAREFAQAVRSYGCRLALDDFGVGFGSLTYLRELPLSYLKIDLSFVRGMTRSDNDRRVVGAIIRIAQEFGLQTVAEGVEDAETQELLRRLGVDFAQGFHLGRPAPIRRGRWQRQAARGERDPVRAAAG